MGYAVALGVLGAFAGLVFMGVVKAGGAWYTDSNPGWFGGQWWWIVVTAAAGVVVGLLRRLTRLPEEVPGLIADLQEQHVNPRLVPGIVVVSAASLIGGASLGPGEGAGFHRRRGRQLDLPATGARRRELQGEHPVRFRRRVRRVVFQHGDRGDAAHGGCPPRRAAVRQGPGREHRGIKCLVRGLFRHRRLGVPGRLPGAVSTNTRTGSCWLASPWACSRPWWSHCWPGS